MALGGRLLAFARLAIEPSREDLQDLTAREDRRLAKLVVKANRRRVVGRAGPALCQVLARAELGLRRKLAV